ncbi:MAG: hypothetical protein R3290_13740, partial [Acidimicrobiia bacterium]|nr:hypothetical protein [Acidimicrobiia bacterium]
MIRPSPTPTRAGLGRVAWTRGEGCRDLAHLLADDPIRIEGDLRASCIDRRVELLVARKLTSFDLVPVVVAHDLDRAGVASVTAAVAEGPHSGLVARVAGALARGLEVPGEFATVVREPDERADARRRLESLHDRHPGMTLRIVERPTAAGLVETLAEDALLVVGAAGGSWLQRQLL